MKSNETKKLGLSWINNKDLLAVEIPSEIKYLTKRTVLQTPASICDGPLGIISTITSTTIIGKIIYCDICDSKILWDKLIGAQPGE